MEINQFNENKVFDELKELCICKGYAHAIAYFCIKSNLVMFNGIIDADDFLPMYTRDRLLRTEITTLIGLMIKGNMDNALLEPSSLLHITQKTEELLENLHHSISMPMVDSKNNHGNEIHSSSLNISSALAMREPIFYAGESAYSFQHLDFSIRRYHLDNPWIEANMGFNISEAVDIINSITQLQYDKLKNSGLIGAEALELSCTLLSTLIFSVNELVSVSGYPASIVNNVLSAFSIFKPQSNTSFNSLNDYNEIVAKPIIRINDKKYLLYQSYSLTQALYESPFYWFLLDKSYVNTAMFHRGSFTETFAKNRLEFVIGKKNVHNNVKIYRNSGKDAVGEIDVLVVFADRIIVLQAKSKRLTYSARSGNDKALQDDFKKSIQDSYDQAFTCSEYLLKNDSMLVLCNGDKLVIDRDIKEIFIICVVSDQYPALSMQCNSFLKHKTSEIIKSPYIADIFILDVLCEMLDSPLYFFSYLNRRSMFYDKLIAESELAILAFHLNQNLWIDNDYTFYIDNDICTDIDAAMSVRRLGFPGKRVPVGILTWLKESPVGRIIESIEKSDSKYSIDLGLFLLELREDTINEINKTINTLSKKSIKDGMHHDFSMMIDKTGLTVHCNTMPFIIAKKNLEIHCESKKYSQRSDRWFGVCINPNNTSLRFAIVADYIWEWSSEFEDSSNKCLTVPRSMLEKGQSVKIGRNDPCPCGSGKKFKKCCGDLIAKKRGL